MLCNPLVIRHGLITSCAPVIRIVTPPSWRKALRDTQIETGKEIIFVTDTDIYLCFRAVSSWKSLLHGKAWIDEGCCA